MTHKGENYSVKMQKYYFCNGTQLNKKIKKFNLLRRMSVTIWSSGLATVSVSVSAVAPAAIAEIGVSNTKTVCRKYINCTYAKATCTVSEAACADSEAICWVAPVAPAAMTTTCTSCNCCH